MTLLTEMTLKISLTYSLEETSSERDSRMPTDSLGGKK